MTTYRVTLEDGQVFYMSAHLTDAAAPIHANFHDRHNDSEWQGTPYQTADARHSVMEAATLCAEYFSTGADDCTDVASSVPVDEED